MNATDDPAEPIAKRTLDQCRRCDLWRDATQGVPGEGSRNARVMLVGEQPGDREDLAGHPFVGPAGAMLDRALAEAGIARQSVYVTNAVKHFKFELRGTRRLHSKPNSIEIAACNAWLGQELADLKPAVVIALGATAARAVLGKTVTIGKARHEHFQISTATQVRVTIHPSYLLRIREKAQQEREYRQFVADLRAAAAPGQPGERKSNTRTSASWP